MSLCATLVILVPKKDVIYHQIRWLLMPFGLSKALNTFMRLMNHVLRRLLGKCVVVYFDDILIYSTCLDYHLLHMRSVLEILRKKTLFSNVEKCVLCTQEVDEEKVKTIQDWPTHKTVGELRSFHGLASFYRWFVKEFSTIATLLNETSFKLECDASSVGIGVVILQEGHLIAYFSEKLKGTQLDYSTYDQELYALTWQHCLLPKEFVIHSNHEALKHLRGQGNLNKKHTKWVEFLEQFPYVIKHKQGNTNLVPFAICVHMTFNDFFRHDGFLFKGKKLCVPMNSIRQLLVRETHEGVLVGHFGELKTLDILSEHFYWPHEEGFLGISPRFFKMAHFIPCHKSGDASHVANLFFRNMVRLHGLSRNIVSDKDTKFLGHFWTSLWSKLETMLLYSTTCHPQMDGQTEVVNRTLGHLLRYFVKKSLRDWEDWILHVEFAYNRVFNSTTSYSPFVLAYGFNPLFPLDLPHLPIMPNCVNEEGLSRAQFVQRLYDKARLNMERKGEQYAKTTNKGRKEVFFKEGDLRFPHLRKYKLLPRKDDLFKIIKKINDNAYKVEIPQEFGASTSFNVINLTPYAAGTQALNLRSNSLQKRENDAYMKRHSQEDEVEEATPALEGPMTRGRLKNIHKKVCQMLPLLLDKERTHEGCIIYHLSSYLHDNIGLRSLGPKPFSVVYLFIVVRFPNFGSYNGLSSERF
ncbi:hypothetical protein CR513_29858, partial [Mucuna pruriens]